MHTVYEAQFFSFGFVGAVFLSVLIMILMVVMFVKARNSHIVIARCICATVFLITLSFLASTILSSIEDWEYAQNNQFVVEGEIEDFSTGNNIPDSFYVDGVYFICTSMDNNLFAYSHSLTKRNEKSVIEGNGQYVRLTYCTQNGLNAILKIETLDNGKTRDDYKSQDEVQFQIKR